MLRLHCALLLFCKQKHKAGMRHDRRKLYKSYLEFFSRTFKVIPPYRIICDGTFLHHFVINNLGKDAAELNRLIGTVLDCDRVETFVVDSAIQELEALGERDTLVLAKQLERLRVGKDLGESLKHTPPEAIKKLIGFRNFKKYLVATVDEELAQQLREIPGVPLLFMRRVMIGLEAPSAASKHFWKKLEENKMKVPKQERKRLFSEVDSTSAHVEGADKVSTSGSSKKRKRVCKSKGDNQAFG